MADTSNLTTFLGDVADAIREKRGTELPIPAADFDTEIRSITTGSDTSDATATADDILYPKTAYVDGERITGNIETESEYLDNVSYSSKRSVVGRITQKQTTKVLPDGNRLCIIDGNINVYDNEMQLLKSYTLSSFGILTSSGKNSVDASSFYDSKDSLLVVLTYSGSSSSSNVTVSMLYYHSGELGVINHDGQTHAYKTFSVDADYGFFATKCYHSRKSFVLASRGYGVYRYDVNDDLSYSVITISTNANLTRVYNADMTSDDKWLVLNHDISWDNSRNVLISLQNNTILKTEDIYTDMILVGNKHIIIKDSYYELDTNANNITLVKETLTGLLNTSTGQNNTSNYGYFRGTYNNDLLAISSDNGNITLLAITNLETGNIVNLGTFSTSNGKNIYTYKTIDGVGIMFDSNAGKDFVLATGIATYLSANIYGSKLYNPYNADILSGDVLQNKIAYGTTGKIIGTMPNNGTLNYTPSEQEQSIPAGYTNGGTIEAMSYVNTLSPSDYNKCLAVSNQILNGISYIQGNGTDMIDTGITPKSGSTVLELDIASSELISWEPIFSCSRDQFQFGRYGTDDYFHLKIGGASYNQSNAVYNEESTHVKIDTVNGIYEVGDESFTCRKTFSNNTTLKLYYGVNDGSYGKSKIYNCKISIDNELVRDFVPTYMNGKYGFYDNISKQFFTSNNGNLIGG